MNVNQLREILELAREGRKIEFKRAQLWDDAEFRAKVTKTVLAFSNVRDGGTMVIGVEEPSDGNFTFVGVDDGVLQTYSEEDVAAHVAEYADPYAKFTLQKIPTDGKTFVVLEVAEFDDIPVICKKSGLCNLRKGALYTRSYRIPESVEVPSQVEMREILEIATEKKVRKYHEMQRRVAAPPVEAAASDDTKFATQLRKLP